MTFKPYLINTLAVLLSLSAWPAFPQAAKDGKKPAPVADRAAAYYHYSLGHLYAELAGAYGNKGDFLDKAIDNYRQALAADPNAKFLAAELSDLYIQAGRLREAVTDAEAALANDPGDLNARRILGRIYTRLIGDSAEMRVNENMVRKAIEQYEKVVERESEDKETWLLLGRLYKLAQESLQSEQAYQKALDLDPDNTDALLGLAMVYRDLGDRPRAAEVLRRVVGKQPDVRTLSLLAGTYEEMEEYALAAENYKAALKLSPDNLELKRAYAQSLLMAEDTDAALRAFQDVVESNPKDAQAQLRISQIYRQRQQYDSAWEAIEAAKEVAPDSLEVLYQEVNLLEAQDRTGDAIAALEKIITDTAKESYSDGERSNRAIFLERVGLMYRSLDQYEDAVRTFERLKELNPELAPRAAAHITDTYRQAKEFSRADSVVEAAYREFPDDRTIGLMRATVYADLGQNGKAVATAKKLLEGKRSREDYLALAQIYEKTRDYDRMAEAIDQAEALSLSDQERVTILFMRGAMYERQKKFDQAEEAFREVLRLEPNNLSAKNYLGYMFADRNMKLQEALQLITKALEGDPHNGAFLDSLGWVYFRLGDLEKAESYLLRAVQKVPKDPVIHDHLGDVYYQRGNLQKAVSHWRLSIREWETSSASEKDESAIAKIQRKLEGALVRLAHESAAGPDQQP